MDKDFERVEKRAATLRLTIFELIAAAGISRATWWRAQNGIVGTPAQVRTLRKAEAKLAELELA